MKKYVTIAGGLITMVSMFLPFVSAYGKTITGMEMNNVAKLFLGLGVFIVAVGWKQQRKAYYFSLFAGLFIAALALKYYSDASQFGKAGIGIWLMLVGGLAAIAGSISGLMYKKRIDEQHLQSVCEPR